MKKGLLTLGVILAASNPLWANANTQRVLGSQCGLIDEADLFEPQGGRTQTLTSTSRLSSLQKKQIKAVLSTLADEEALEDSSKSDLEILMEASEGGDVYYQTGTFRGQKLQIIRYYPGGNPAGYVFLRNSVLPLAAIQDSDLVCVLSFGQ